MPRIQHELYDTTKLVFKWPTDEIEVFLYKKCRDPSGLLSTSDPPAYDNDFKCFYRVFCLL